MNRTHVSNIVIEYADKFGPTNRPERKVIEKSLRQVEPLELFEGLFSIFLLESDEKSYIRQQNAGVILYKLKPRVLIDLKTKIRMCLQTWDVSVEELPLYFVERCGKGRVLEVIEKLKAEPLSERERLSLSIFTSWLGEVES
ncbi:hypothetical protein A7985_07395 [Pseudoalteromonas luteoviolacea]|uniref:Uncharacterized protein n=1 Tax=Pseudoalteromonas luteoviolacea TaxID=43657 RepID=A0A1C0TWQ2_9GAMM|nr:hypothetical protein [Pseudoalteromonas luteoviolacea]OCQ23756.1 hypothetical protein A7985_07395 [Pseudoalteromonas luteoviolacea]